MRMRQMTRRMALVRAGWEGTCSFFPFSLTQAMMDPMKVTIPMKMPITMNTICVTDSFFQ